MTQPKNNKAISMFHTYIDAKAYERVKKVLNSGFLSEGNLVKEFENKLIDYLGFINPVAVNSGTSALHLALVLAGVKPGDEVICPAQTFVATASVIVQEKATPIFADIQYETGNIDPHSFEEHITPKTKAIIVVHWGGYPCDMDPIHRIAKKYNISVIEDAAHALGATYKNRPIGSISNFTCFSFQAIKHVTTGDGGVLCVKDPRLAKMAFERRWFGINRKKSRPSILGERKYDIMKVGYKYHLNDYSAALGLANLENFKKRLQNRRATARLYSQAFRKVSGITLFEEDTNRESAYWLFGFHVEKREKFIRNMKQAGISTSVVHLGIDHNSLFGGKRKNLIQQRRFEKTQIHIPMHDGLDKKDVDRIINIIQKGW